MICIIPARGGSKGVPGKNHRPFATGPSLVQRAIFVAQGFGSHIYVTTDDPIIAAQASQHVAVIDRPPELAQDRTPMLPVIQHALSYLRERKWADGAETVAILQPTQPFRTHTHILAARQIMAKHECDSVVSVVAIPAHYSPCYALDIVEGGELAPYDSTIDDIDGMTTHRQAARKTFSRDGTIYLTRRSVLEEGSIYGSHCMPLVIPGYDSVNIDTEEDWVRAEELARRRGML